MKYKTLDSFFSKKRNFQESSSPYILETSRVNVDNVEIADLSTNGVDESSSRVIQKLDHDSTGFRIERDPGLHMSIWSCPINKRDEIRRAYLIAGPYQGVPINSSQFVDKHRRKFLPAWYKKFPDWLEYSPTKNVAYCLPCFLFIKPSVHPWANAFNVDGFQAWKKVSNGENCSFLIHEGKCPNSSHKIAVKQSHDLMNSLQHIERIIDKQSSEMVEKNRLRLKVSIDVAKLCAFQGIAFRACDECPDSDNRGNFLEIISHTASYNDEVRSIVLEKAPGNASYTSPQIQKEILSLYASKIQRYIREEIGDAKYCIIVDESRDESKREQMAIVLRFVDKDGFIRERFLDIVHVEDTKATTLKRDISAVLSHNNLKVQNMRGQGYDGASTMRGEWNGLQALFLKECLYAYYVHCFAHRLQLVLVAVAKSVIPVEHFFSHVTVIVNLVDSSSKRHDQLQSAQSIQTAELTSTNELDTGKGKNQIGSVQRPGDTRWGSHLRSLHSVRNMFKSVLLVLQVIVNEKNNLSFRATADGAYDTMTSFEFVFILHFMIELLEMTDDLCGILQCKNQDIVNEMDVVLITKELLQRYRDNKYDQLLDEVKSFYEKYEIIIPDMNAQCCSDKGRVLKGSPVTLRHHYQFDIFMETLDSILLEMNNRFNDDTIELLRLSSALDPRDGYKSFNIDNICELMEKFYPDDFSSQEKLHMKYQLEHFEIDIRRNELFQKVSTLSELCQLLSKTGKTMNYYLVDRLVRLTLTLPVSTATTKRAFSSMKIVKTRLRNKMEDDFLSSSLLMYIEKEIAEKFDVDSIVDEFDGMKKRRVQLKKHNLNKS